MDLSDWNGLDDAYLVAFGEQPVIDIESINPVPATARFRAALAQKQPFGSCALSGESRFPPCRGKKGILAAST